MGSGSSAAAKKATGVADESRAGTCAEEVREASTSEPERPHDLSTVEGRAASMQATLQMSKAEFRDHMARLQNKFTLRAEIGKTENRGLSLAQLQDIQTFAEQNCELWRDLAPPEHSKTSGQILHMDVLNLYHMCAWCILPATHVDNCSFVELLADGDQIPHWFCSHWWGEPIQDFVSCVEVHQSLRETDLYWICAYANRQHSLQDELVTDPSQTSFYKAMCLSKGVLIILDEVGPATPFTRIWCAFEAYVALVDRPREEAMLLDISCRHDKTTYLLTDGLGAGEARLQELGNFSPSSVALAQSLKGLRQMCFPSEVVEHGLKLELHHAQASRDIDRRRILNSFVGRTGAGLDEPPHESHPKYEEVNIRLRAVLAEAAWDQVAVSQSSSFMANVAHCLAADRWRDSLIFDLSRLPTADNWALQSAGRSLSQQLQSLKVDCSTCSKITSRGLEAFAQHLPKGLRALSMNFMMCEGISNKGMAALAARLPRSLEKLDLGLAQSGVSNVGLAALASGMPTALRELRLDLNYCSKISDSGLAALGDHLPSRLRCLKIVLAGRQPLTDAGLAALFKLPADVQEVELVLLQTDWLTDAGFAAVVTSLPPSVKKATIRPHLCRTLSPAARNVAERHLDDMREWLQDCRVAPAAPADGDHGLFDSASLLQDAVTKEPIEAPEQADGGSLALPIVSQDQLDIVLPLLISGLSRAPRLRLLQLDFQDCPEAFGDEELGRLASALPSGLVTLNLCLWGLGKISGAGASALSSGLPGALRDFTLMLGGQWHDAASGLAALDLRETLLAKLTIYVGNASDVALATFASNLPSSLQRLDLTLMQSYSFSDAGLAALAAYLPHAVELKLELNTGTELSREAQEVAKSATRDSLTAWLQSSQTEPAKPAAGSQERAV
ncbi:FBL4 [Symbiodinium sp. CCMP2592]|nr:FBL4 [Symbiodinium sp. CCMP2592]